MIKEIKNHKVLEFRLFLFLIVLNSLSPKLYIVPQNISRKPILKIRFTD